jgi:NAD(P)-dependent dehydrogenase (short-subunit alcohol dehydrogenase family)
VSHAQAAALALADVSALQALTEHLCAASAQKVLIQGGADGIGSIATLSKKTEAVARGLGTEFHVADFTKLSEVCALADKLREKHPRIDVLANNAGSAFGRERRVTRDGHEITFQVNYLAGFLLTTRLMDRLLESQATVVFTSSLANRLGHINLENLENEKNYGPHKAYCNSKLAKILFTRELHRRYGRRGLAAAALHPGIIATNIYSERGWVMRLLHLLYRTPIGRMDSFARALEKPETLLPVYALLNRIRLCASDAVLAKAERILATITEQYFPPNRSIEEMRALVRRSADPLRSFGEACRVELKSMRSAV